MSAAAPSTAHLYTLRIRHTQLNMMGGRH
jgi:hypothetical protein